MKPIQAIGGILPLLDADGLDRQKLFSLSDAPHSLSGTPSNLEKIAQYLGKVPVSAVQLRCKRGHAEAFQFFNLWIQALRTYAPHIIIILNDHVEWVLELQADGVHVGQEDTPVAQCRQILGPRKIIGLSTHALKEVLAANQEEVDYLGFGPIFATNSKTDAQPEQGLTRLAAICQAAQKPVVAIGGIQPAQVAATQATGASAVAMIGGLWDRENWPKHLQQACNQWKREP